MDTVPREIIFQIILDLSRSRSGFKDVLNFLKCSKTIYSTLEKDGFISFLMSSWFELFKTKNFDKAASKLITYNKLDALQIIIDNQYNLDKLLLLYCIHDRLDLLKEILRSPTLPPENDAKPSRIPILSNIPKLSILPKSEMIGVGEPKLSVSHFLGGATRTPKVYSVANPGSFKSESLNVACEHRNVEMVQELVRDSRVRMNSDIIETAIDTEDEFTLDIFSALYSSYNWEDRHTKIAYRIAYRNGNEEILKEIEECEGWGEGE